MPKNTLSVKTQTVKSSLSAKALEEESSFLFGVNMYMASLFSGLISICGMVIFIPQWYSVSKALMNSDLSPLQIVVIVLTWVLVLLFVGIGFNLGILDYSLPAPKRKLSTLLQGLLTVLCGIILVIFLAFILMKAEEPSTLFSHKRMDVSTLQITLSVVWLVTYVSVLTLYIKFRNKKLQTRV